MGCSAYFKGLLYFENKKKESEVLKNKNKAIKKCLEFILNYQLLVFKRYFPEVCILLKCNLAQLLQFVFLHFWLFPDCQLRQSLK